MKIIKTILLILFVISIIHAQIDTTVWIPYQIGNYWEYKGMEGLLHFDRLVVGDTTRADGFSYYVIKETNYSENTEQYIYRRIEDSTKVYNHNSLLYDFSLSKDDNWQVFSYDSSFHRRVYDEGEEFFELTNQSHQFKVFEDLYTNGHDTAYIERKWERVYKGIGEVIIGEWGGQGELVKAKIGDKIYTKESLAEYYPLQVGNKWLYKTSTYDVGTTPTISYHTKEVVGDTLMNNGENYFVIEEGNSIYFERFDSTTNEIIRYNDWQCWKIDNPIYSLNYVTNDTITWTYCDNALYQISYNEPFGPDSGLINIRGDFLVVLETSFRKNLGLYSESVTEISMGSTNLIGAEIDGKVWGTLTDVADKEMIDYQFILSQNYPNPFNPSTTIKFTIPTVRRSGASPDNAKLTVYDILGREIKTLLNKKISPGSYEVEFNGKRLPSGVYFYRLINGNLSQTKKMLLMK